MARGASAVHLGWLAPEEITLPHPEWHRHVGRILSRRQVQEVLQVASSARVDELVEQGQLLGLPAQENELAFPAFQFTDDGRILPVLPAILATFGVAEASPYTIASWFVTPQLLLRRQTPSAWLRQGKDPELVKEAARRSASRLGQ